MELGSAGKAKAILYFITKGYDVFTEFEGKSPFDFIIHKDGILKRVEVKTTKTRAKAKYNTGWVFQIKRVRPNRTKAKIYKFDKKQCDILAFYIQPIDKLIIKETDSISSTCAHTIFDKEISGSVAELVNCT